MLAETGMVTDPSKIWWDMRPSAKHPTLEIRICDICTWSEDGLTIAALYQSILTFLAHLKANNQRWRHYRRILILENKWRAQRYGVEARDGRLRQAGAGAFPRVGRRDGRAPAAARRGRSSCVAEVEHARVMARRGTSADHQLRVYHAALEAGAERPRGPGRRGGLADRPVGHAGRPGGVRARVGMCAHEAKRLIWLSYPNPANLLALRVDASEAAFDATHSAES